MTRKKLTEDQRHQQFRLTRLAEQSQKAKLDVHHGIDVLAKTQVARRLESRRHRRVEQTRVRISRDLDAFEKQLAEVKPDDTAIDYLAELKRRHDRQAIDNRRRRKRLEKIICDHDQEALLREKKDRWAELDSILKRKPVSERAIDDEFDRIANAIRKGIDNRHYFEEQLRRLEANRGSAALKRDSQHHLLNCRLYDGHIHVGLERIR